MIELGKPYVADDRDYIFTVEGIWTEDSTKYTPPKKVVLNYYNGVYTGYRFEGFTINDIPDAEDELELMAIIRETVKELNKQQ